MHGESRLLNADSIGYIEELLADGSLDPDSLSQELKTLLAESDTAIQQRKTKQKFKKLAADNYNQPGSSKINFHQHDVKQKRVLQFINAYRFTGHMQARLDPLERPKQDDIDISNLKLSDHELSNADLELEFESGSFRQMDRVRLAEIYEALKATYCSSIGFEYMHIPHTAEKRWIQDQIEPVRAQPNVNKETKTWLLQRLIAAETFEKFLHSKYVGQKRFSLEGGESLIPLLNILIEHASVEHAVEQVALGMAHRGRLNVLVNIMGKHAEQLFEEFEGKVQHVKDRTGDVKYHSGFASNIRTAKDIVHVALAFNPSHLEIVNPVVEGFARAHQDMLEDAKGNLVLPIIIHGDAAVAGQGVVMETLNMSQSRGYSTKGTLHVVVNNQIGFTTSFQSDARSTYYCTDVAKMVNAPIFHVNAEDPEAVLFVTKLAVDYRMKYHKDVFIDLVCYRRQGHNEADEPAVTQPMMYKKIRSLKTTQQNYAQKLIEDQVLSEAEVQAMIKDYRQRLNAGERVAYNVANSRKFKPLVKFEWGQYTNGGKWNDQYDLGILQKDLDYLSKRLQELPEDFELHPIVKKVMDDRSKMARGEIPCDWGFAENLAYATIASIGYQVRLSGQDSGRGTFFHRHSVLHNQKNGESYIPLQHLHGGQGQVQIIDSILSEEAVLGFEYGYATANPDALVIWEAQFGDFANGAQAVFDQFIASAETKWGKLCGLTMFLPHGLEGQGPEHSSARLERYLQACARYNIQVCVPSTASQIFHLLRRQVLRRYRKPLVVLTPKSLLRNKLASSPLHKFKDDGFKIVIGEQYENIKPDAVNRIVLCSGKIFYELLEKRQAEQINNVALIRIEQIYPFSRDWLLTEMEKFPNATKIIWCQEEPINQGVWHSSRHHFVQVVKAEQTLSLVSRPLSSAPAEGSLGLHRQRQAEIIDKALGLQALDED